MAKLTKRQQEIIRIAIELIAEESIQVLTIKNLSSQLGLTEGAIYRHFPSKLDILLNILLKFQYDAKQLLDQACASDLPTMDQIENIFIFYNLNFIEKSAIANVIFSESIYQNDPELSREVFRLLEIHEETLSCIIENGQKNNEITNKIHKNEIIRMIIGSQRYTITKWRLGHYQFKIKDEGKILTDAIRQLITI